MVHSSNVAKKALRICKEKNLQLDHREVFCAAMLHDIGVVKCNAPDIQAKGQLPYILHGVEGEKILLENGLDSIASVCATHTGAGISQNEIIEQKLPLPRRDFLPTTLLEKLICYSDKFYSKSGDLHREKDVEEIRHQMKKFGNDSLERFDHLHSLFG